jgi:hypothetical protein
MKLKIKNDLKKMEVFFKTTMSKVLVERRGSMMSVLYRFVDGRLAMR